MYTDIKSYEDACADQGLNPNNKPDVTNIPDDFKEFVTASYEMAVVNKSLNKDEDGNFWEPDFNNPKEEKWLPVFDASSGFSLIGSVCTDTTSHVGARLVYRDSEISDYAGTQFESIYRRMHIKA